MYNSLLLSAGGGIISDKQKSGQKPDPVVVIGCGGTGAMGLHALKDRVYRYLEPDNPGEPVPRYDHIRFLAIDSDAEWIRKTNLDSDSEFCRLHDPSFLDKVNNRDSLADMMEDSRYQWLSADQEKVANIRIPADPYLLDRAPVRQLGRYLAVNGAQKIYDSIREAVDRAVLYKDANRLVIHILACISGGMGSGSFLDVCYITRKVLMDKGITGAGIFGYFFLPDVITAKEEVKGDNTKIQTNYRNGYAALMELDYLMQLRENHDSFVQDYGTFQINTRQPPVDICHLVSAVDANGNEHIDGFRHCIDVTADYIMSFLFSIPKDAMWLSPMGSIGNRIYGMNMLPVTHGAYNRYLVLGASGAEIPTTEAATYLAGGLYDKMSRILLKTPVDQDVENFAAGIMKLTVPELKKTLSQNIKQACPVPCPQMETVKMITQPYVHAEPILRPMDDWLYAQQGQADKNYQGLNEEVKIYRYDTNATSLIGRMFNELIDLCLNPEYGPSYAAMLLERNGKTVLSVLQGLLTEADKQEKEAKKQEEFQAEQVELAKNAFTSSSNTFLDRKRESRAYEAYRDALGIWYRRKLDTILYQEMCKLIVNLKEKVELMNKVYFRKLKNMLDELKQTFTANAVYFNDPKVNSPAADDGYTKRIVVFSEMKAHLDDVLEKEHAESAAQAFTRHLIKHAAQWSGNDERCIYQMINEFMNEYFKQEMSRTMDDYLKEKFPGLVPQQIRQKLYHQLFRQLYDRSEPWFWCFPFASITDTYTSASLFVPARNDNVVAAAKEYENMNFHSVSVSPCGIGDRIFMFRLYCGLPLYAYFGLHLFKRAYDDSIATAGVHLYERGEINWKERLVSPVPFSIDKTQTRNYQCIETAIKEAEEIGILKFEFYGDDPEDIVSAAVYRSSLREKKELMDLLKALHVTGDNSSDWTAAVQKAVMKQYFEEDGVYSSGLLYDTLDQIEGYMDSMRQAEDSVPMAVLCDGTANKKEVCIDHLVQAYVLRNTLMEEVALYHSLELAAERLKKIEERAIGHNSVFESFFNALVLGELNQGIGRISFTYEEEHGEVKKELASKSMPLGKYLLYQAFVTFRDMDTELQDMIREKTDKKMNDLQEGDDAIAEKLYDKYTPRMLEDLERQYRREKECEEIGSFYEDLVDHLVSFLDQFE